MFLFTLNKPLCHCVHSKCSKWFHSSKKGRRKLTVTCLQLFLDNLTFDRWLILSVVVVYRITSSRFCCLILCVTDFLSTVSRVSQWSTVCGKPCASVRRRSRQTFSTHFEFFWRRVDGVVIYFFNVTHRSFRHASPHLWNQLPTSLRIPHPNYSSPSQRPSFEHAGLTCYTLLSPSITFSLFHSELKTYLFIKSYPPP